MVQNQKNELDIRQQVTGFDQCVDALFLREAAKVQDIALFFNLFRLHLFHKVVHRNCLGRKQWVGCPSSFSRTRSSR